MNCIKWKVLIPKSSLPTVILAGLIAFLPPLSIARADLYVPSTSESGAIWYATTSGTYRFTITAGAWSPWPDGDPGDQGWKTGILGYKNRPVEWAPDPSFPPLWGPINSDFGVGDGTYQPTYDEAEAVGIGMFVDVSLEGNEYVVLLAPDHKGYYYHNRGGIYFSISIVEQQPIVEIIGPQPPITVLYNPVSRSPHVVLDTQVEPPGGEYAWEIVAGQDKVRFVGKTNGEAVKVQATAPSEEIGDVIIEVSYWVDSQSCEDIYSLTVQKPTFLEIAQGPLTKVEYNDQGQVIYYLTNYWFQVMDQLGPDAQPIIYKMVVLEEREVFCNNYRTGPIKKHRDETNNLGVFRDDLIPPRYRVPIPIDLLIKVNQAIEVEGWYVGLRCQTYYYDHATSEWGVCGPCE